MKTAWRKNLMAACTLAVLALCAFATSRADDGKDGGAKVEIDKAVAPFSLPDVRSGKTIEAGNWAKQRATVFIFVAVRCPFSNAYNERYNKLINDYGDKGVRLLAINSNASDSTSAVADHANEHGFQFPVLKDDGNKIADVFGAGTTPEVYVVDDDGILRYHGRFDDNKNEDAVKTHDLLDALDAILAGKEVAVKETNAFGCSIKRVRQ